MLVYTLVLPQESSLYELVDLGTFSMLHQTEFHVLTMHLLIDVTCLGPGENNSL